MKKIKLMTAFLTVCSMSFGQYNFYNPEGSVYLGAPTNGNINGVDLQVHGVKDWCVDENGTDKGQLNCYKETRIQMTNTITGQASSDGFMFRLLDNNFSMRNLEKKNIELSTGNLRLKFDGQSNRLWLGSVASLSSDVALYNVVSTNENGIFIRTKTAGKYGLSIATRKVNDNAIQVLAANRQDKNFTVQGNGFVFARKYTTTLANIPDYVFDTNYNLMPLSNLRTYINTNKHLPNIPSATEFEETGVDLGELNRLLLEKTEELTLYILQLEKRLSKLETRE